MRIDYGRVAYVHEVPFDMLDLITAKLNTTAIGEYVTIVDIEEIISYIKDYDNKALADFLENITEEIIGETGGIFFCR